MILPIRCPYGTREYLIIKTTSQLLSKEQEVQECDATGDDSSNAVEFINSCNCLETATQNSRTSGIW